MKWVSNVFFITLPALAALVLILEVLARTLLPTSDIPDVRFDSRFGNHFAPNQRGRYVSGIGPEIMANYRINANGWNSPYDYVEESQAAIRIAVIGDSYVEAFQVDYDRSFPYLAETQLNETSDDKRYQFYSFGHSGANLAQYLSVYRTVVTTYHPEVVVFNIVHNDFQETLYGFGRRDTWTIRRTRSGFEEVPPQPANNLSIKRFARHAAILRYALYNLHLQRRSLFLKQFFYGDVRRFEANIDTSSKLLKDEKALTHLVDYVLQKIRHLSEPHKTKVLFLIDGHRRAIYQGKDPRSSVSYRFNRVLSDLCRIHSIPMTDLTDAFVRIWHKEKQMFNSNIDNHWNTYGHQIVADQLVSLIKANVVETVHPEK